MHRFPQSLPTLALAALLAACVAVRAETPNLDSLVANSPFTAPTSGRGRADAATPLEFRGVLYEGKTPFFSIFEAATKKSAWVELNEGGLDYLVRSYDEPNSKLQVDYQGRPLTLALVQAPKVARAPGAMSPGQFGGAPVSPGAAAGSATIAPPAPNPQLPAQIAEEIRRRRALRQQAVTPTNPPAPTKP